MKIKKILSLMLVALLVTTSTTNVFAAEASNTKVDLNEVKQILEDSVPIYTINTDGSVVEEVTFHDSQNNVATVSKLIFPNGNFKTTVIYPNGTTDMIYGDEADYDIFLKLANNEVIIQQAKDQHQQAAITPFGSEISGSQYIHVYIGTSGTTTIYGDELKKH